jgi:hypothetical protein
VMVVQVPVGRAARHRAAPVVAREHAMLAAHARIVRAPALEGVVEQPAPGRALCWGPFSRRPGGSVPRELAERP